MSEQPNKKDAEVRLQALRKFVENLEAVYTGKQPAVSSKELGSQVEKCLKYAKNYTTTPFGAGALFIVLMMVANRQSFSHLMEHVLDLQDYFESVGANRDASKN